MFQTQLKLIFRSFRHNALFSGINVSSFAVGLAACWLIALYVEHEQHFDRFVPDADRICAVALDLKMGNEEGRTTNTPPPLGPRILADFPQVETAARSFNLRDVVVRREQAGQASLVFNESGALAVDTSFLALFQFPMMAGTVGALNKPGTMVLTEKTARKYFGNTDPLGQPLRFGDRLFTVTGILRDLPSNSSLQFDFLLPMADFKIVDHFSWSWIWLQVDTWVRLRQTATKENRAAIEAGFPAMVRTYAPAAFERVGQNFADNLKRGDRFEVRLLPLLSLHLDQPALDSRLGTLSDGNQVRTFGIAGLLVFLLACANFMNLSTARSLRRAREVGVRKALGSQRSALVGQFLTEAMLYAFTGMLLAGLLAGASMPLFNRLTGLEMQFRDLFGWNMLVFVVLLPLLAGMLGGLYPAFYLSRFKTSEIFKPLAGAKNSHGGLRSGLVVFQFSVCLVLMLCAWIVFQQLEYVQNRLPGLDRSHVLVIPNMRQLGSKTSQEAFRQQLLQMPEVVSASQSTFLPALGSFGDFYEPEQGDETRPLVKNLPISSYMTDAEFIPNLGITLVAGRNFQPNSAMDSASVILNETAVKTIGWTNPLGKWLRYPGNQNQRFQVIGVMRDFNINSAKTPIEPVALFHESSKSYQTWGAYLAVRLRPGAEKSVIEKAGALWKSSAPGIPFDYDFLDASFARLYKTEAKTGAVLGAFTGLALFIGCLGLFALAVFTAERRTKEIGIRKVLGASIVSITAMLTRDFLKLVLLAVLIASPIAWFIMQHWLADYAYRIDVPWWVFGAVALIALAIASLTIGFQSVAAAMTNPVKTLKNE